jgi:hypothetical protein
MEDKLRAYPKLRKELDIEGMSGSQLSRRINDLPTEKVQKLFLKVVEKIRQLFNSKVLFNKTCLILPLIA